MARWYEHEWVDLGTELLDRQIVDPEGLSVAKVDDLELHLADDGTISVGDILVGGSALVGRLNGWAMRLAGAFRIAGEAGQPHRIQLRDILRVDSAVMITRHAADAVESPIEHRLDEIIKRIPGSGHAGV